MDSQRSPSISEDPRFQKDPFLCHWNFGTHEAKTSKKFIPMGYHSEGESTAAEQGNFQETRLQFIIHAKTKG